MKLLHFLLTYQNCLFFAMFGVLALVAFVNFSHDPYATQNARFKKFNKRILQKPSSVVLETKCLPAEYQRQWRAFVNSGCQKPSVVFEFVKLPKRYLLWFAHFVATVLCVAYFVVAFAIASEKIFAIQTAFALCSVLVILLTKLIADINLQHARRIFGKTVHSLNTVTAILKGGNAAPQSAHLQADVDNCSKQAVSLPQGVQTITSTPAINSQPTQTTPTTFTSGTNGKQICSQDSTALSVPVTTKPLGDESALGQTVPPTQAQVDENCDDVIEKTVRILNQKGLDNPRTVEEQRRLNLALNNLLQACCKKPQ